MILGLILGVIIIILAVALTIALRERGSEPLRTEYEAMKRERDEYKKEVEFHVEKAKRIAEERREIEQTIIDSPDDVDALAERVRRRQVRRRGQSAD